MALIWGWGPFAVKLKGDELQAAERLRTTFRLHHDAVSKDLYSAEALAAIEVMLEDRKSLAAVIAERFSSSPGLEAMSHSPLGLLLVKATLAASALNIEYEMQGAAIAPATGDPMGPVCWEVRGTARETATDRSSPGRMDSEVFERADEVSREAQFLVAACRAYIEAINGIVDIGRGEERLYKCPACSRNNAAPTGLPSEIYCECGHYYWSSTRLRSNDSEKG